MKIICSTNIPFAQNAFAAIGDVTILEPHAITPDRVRNADILIIRSTTKVNGTLLKDSKVQFVGTTTIGTDHIDLDYLEHAGIAWCAAPGCNANSVSEYISAALLCLSQRFNFKLQGKTIGVIGVGNIGKLVVQKSEALGLKVLQNDPPRYEETGNPVFKSLKNVLAESDIITLHVPITKSGHHPTFHLVDNNFLKQLKRGCILLNAARGPVVDSNALLAALADGVIAHAVLDTWEGEPAFRTDLLEKVDIGTAHIAGHSFDGKVMGTVVVFSQLCRFLGIKPIWTQEHLMPKPTVPEISVNASNQDTEALLWKIVRQVYDIQADDSSMRAIASHEGRQRVKEFKKIRLNYPVRREFPFTIVTIHNCSTELRNQVQGIGFKVKS